MKKNLLDILVYPVCGGRLQINSFQEQNGETEEGFLLCACKEWFPVLKGVPRMLTKSQRGDYSEFLSRYSSELPVVVREDLNKMGFLSEDVLKKKTSRSFGMEWKKFNRFGWENEAEDIDVTDFRSVAKEYSWEHTVITFFRKSMFSSEDLRGKIVLDIGCGNGRYAYAALTMFTRIEVLHEDNFDWFSAPVATHHTEKEIMSWFRKAGLAEIKGNDPVNNPDSYFAKIYPEWARRKDGRVKPLVARVYPPWAVGVRGRKKG